MVKQSIIGHAGSFSLMHRIKQQPCMVGLLTMLISIFFLIGGLYLGSAGLPDFVDPSCLAAGLILLAVGIVFYRVIRSD